MKKLLSVLVILCMVSSLLCVPAMAEETASNGVKYEFEEYYPYMSSTSGQTKTHSLASGGSYLRDILSAEAREFSFDVPISEAGYYNIRYVSSDRKTSSASQITFKLDGKTLGENLQTEGTQITDWTGYAGAFDMRSYEKTYVYLDASIHTVTVNAALAGETTIFYLDYIEFEYITPPAIGEENSRIELDNFAPSGVKSTASAAPNGYYIFKNEVPISYDPSFEFDVTVEKSGFYNITYIAGHKAASNISKITLKLGNTVIGTNESIGAEKTAVYNSTYNNAMPMYRYEKNKVWLDKGEYILSVNFAETASTETTKTYIFQMDYIEFESVPYEPVSSEESTRFEFEAYANASLKNTSITSDTPSNGYYIYKNEAPITYNPSFKIPVSFEESGYFDITYVAGQYLKNQSSSITFVLEEREIGKNDTSLKETVNRYCSATYNDAMPMSKYEKEMVWIEKGEYILHANISPITSTDSSVYRFQMDYIEFTPVKEEVVVSDGNVTATALYENAVSGTPILALYDGDDFVIAKVYDKVTSTEKVELTIETAENFTKAKVFIWNNMTDIKPILGAKILNK